MVSPLPDTISRRVHIPVPVERVYALLATADGRRRFWAESADETDGVIDFRFADGTRLRSRIVERRAPERFVVEYFGGGRAAFDLADDGGGGTDLTLTETGVPETERLDNWAGWVTVLLVLKAAVVYRVDLRNHDPGRGWAYGYVDV